MSCAFLTTSLNACATSGSAVPVQAKAPPVPEKIVKCFDETVKLPKGPWTRRQVVELLSQVRGSELQKAQCGKDLIAMYNDLRPL